VTDQETNIVYEQYLRLSRQLGHYRWFSWTMKHFGSRLDRLMIKASRGRVSISGPAMQTMLLTTKGRKTGKERTVPVYFVRDGGNLVAVCENFGLKTPSSWPKNLLAEPKARIEVDGRSADYISRIATEDEIARNMPKLVAMWPAHDTYLERSGMRSVFVFEPV